MLVSVDGLADFYLDDPVAEIPTLRRLASEGTRAQGMTASWPTVTWPNHTTLVTGVPPAKHGVLGNSVLDRSTRAVIPLVVDPVFNKDELVKAPTVYDVAKQAGLKTAALIWPASRGAKTLDWTVPDVGSLDHVKQFSTPSLLEEFSAAGIPWEKQEEWWEAERITERDRMFADMGAHIIGRHRPHLLLMHFVELDHSQHRHGPRSPEAYAALKQQDACIARLCAALEQHFAGRASLMIVSDHGFVPYRQQILPNVLLRQEGVLTSVGSRITGGTARALAQGGSSFIYLFETQKEAKAQLAARLAQRFREVEGIASVLTTHEFAAHGLPDPDLNPHMGDLVLSAKSGYSFGDMPVGEAVVAPPFAKARGSHGCDPAEDGMQAAFIAWGAGIRRGHTIGVVSNISVAPTLAALLGLKMEQVDGPVLKDVLAE